MVMEQIHRQRVAALMNQMMDAAARRLVQANLTNDNETEVFLGEPEAEAPVCDPETDTAEECELKEA